MKRTRRCLRVLLGAASLLLAAACNGHGVDEQSRARGLTAATIGDGLTYGDFPDDPGSGSASVDAGAGSGSGSGSGSDACPATTDPDDLCTQLANGTLSTADVDQQTIDECNCQPPQPSGCSFSMVPLFYDLDQGCNVFDTIAGENLGNYSVSCPSDPYEQQSLCNFARQARGPARTQPDAVPWLPGVDEPPDSAFPQGFDYPNPADDGFDPSTGQPAYVGPITEATYGFPGDPLPNDFVTFLAQGPRPMSETDFYRQNEFRSQGVSSPRNVVVLGSSMMSTHNQTQNGAMCGRFSTRADRRGLRGNDFPASPAWSTRVPWAKALALGRTGYATNEVRNGGAPDACGNPWRGPASPMQMGVNWLTRVGTSNGLMVTDGGLINDQQSVTGGWSDSLAALVACNAMERMTNTINTTLAVEYAALNAPRILIRGRAAARPPTVTFIRQMPPGGLWANALDIAPPGPYARCWYQQRLGAGKNPVITLALLNRVDMTVPPLVRLAPGLPPLSPVPGNLTAIQAAYTAIDVKQIWLQYPYMDQAQVVLRAPDLKLLWGGVAQWIMNRWGPAPITLNAIDRGSVRRIRQVTDDLNGLMYLQAGCPAPFAPGHAAAVCGRNRAGAPRVVITQDAFPAWGPADHQTTIKGGMPHESAAGANKLGRAITAADALP